MEMKECKHYPNCEAPICPLDSKTKDIAVWYKTEQICRNSSFVKERWRINQFRIRNRKYISDEKYFNLKILDNIKTLNRRITGISPESKVGYSEEMLLNRLSKQKRITQ